MRYSIDFISSYLDEYDFIKKIVLYIKNISTTKIKMYKIENGQEVILNNNDIETYIRDQFFSSGNTIDTTKIPTFYFKINDSFDFKIHRQKNLSNNIYYNYNLNYNYLSSGSNTNVYLLSMKYFRNINNDKFEIIYYFPFSFNVYSCNLSASAISKRNMNIGYIDSDNYLEIFLPDDINTNIWTVKNLKNFSNKHLSIKFIKDSNNNDLVGLDGYVLNNFTSNYNNNNNDLHKYNSIEASNGSISLAPNITNCGFFSNSLEIDNIYLKKLLNYDYEDYKNIDYLDGYKLIKLKDNVHLFENYDYATNKSIYSCSNAPEYRIITIENTDYFVTQYNLLLPYNS